MPTHTTSETGLAGVLSRPGAESAGEWRPRRIGPRFRWLDRDRIEIADGPLAGSEYGVKIDLQNSSAELSLNEKGAQVGDIKVEREPAGPGVTVRQVVVRDWLRGNGMASIMTWIIFRELVQSQETATFRIRMSCPQPAGAKGIEIRNAGIGIIAARLGFEPEIDLARLLDSRDVKDVDVILRRDGNPPGLAIMIRSAPHELAAFALEPGTMKPYPAEETYLDLTRNERMIRELARSGHLVISNADYVLRRGHAERFADILATDEDEARLFRLRVRGL